MTSIVEPTLAASARSAKRKATPLVLAVLHPKGGVGRSTTVWQLGAELALRGKRVRIEDLDQGRHLSRVFERHPLGLEGLQLANSPLGKIDADVVLLDTAPEAQRERALDVLQRLRALAAIKRMSYQRLLKSFVIERLYEEERREGVIPPGKHSSVRLVPTS